ncbi:PAS/PAC sensor-containing diguanylate cyclase [Paenibacillus mucilaginosus 3016]|uniref:PAS/PAC sensor-containing diguanylate cyclase n=1 Tax=Paenibacillus mucilaginosus 3016 TaxID=1116391 RepID=H6NCN3_9BACL|nr:sensor domain-containing diguanylate cyclase [Paenibacillus mucilaginosus]AFC28962.1 PAS/PAC sensor-containing diguanylate cyclase [Paenibacillus mucilaginosus 3016]WFA17710.1 sensor domain-containing diguanylate cyclase [Paenibacillus mucilaginosus]
MMLYSLIYIGYIVSTFYLFYFSIEVYLKNRNNFTHRLAALLLFLMSTWFFLQHLKSVYITNVKVSQLLVFWLEYPVLSFIIAIGTHLSMIATYKFEGFNRRLLLSVCYLPALLFSVSSPIPGWVHRVEIDQQGYSLFYPAAGLYLFLFLAAAYFIVGIVLFATYRSEDAMERRKNSIWLFGLSATFGWGIFAGVVGALYPKIPLIAVFGCLYWALSLRVTMIKYASMPGYELRFKKLYDLSPDPIVLLSKDMTIEDANIQCLNRFQISRERLIGTSFYDLFVQEDRHKLTREMNLCLAVGELNNKQISCTTHLGEPVVFSLDSDILEIEYERVRFMIIRDITTEKNYEAQIINLAYHDILTGLRNRVSFHEDTNTLLEEHTPFAVLVIDLDGFKQINDTYGHDAGDEVLKYVSRILGEEMSGLGRAYRLGGDEFIIVIPECLGREPAAEAAERIMRRLKTTFQFKGNCLEVSGSIGISMYPQDGQTSDEVVKRADHDMYVMKKKSKLGAHE